MSIYQTYEKYKRIRPDGLTRDEFERIQAQTDAFLDRYTHQRARTAIETDQLQEAAAAVTELYAKGASDRSIEAAARERLRGTGLNGAL